MYQARIFMKNKLFLIPLLLSVASVQAKLTPEDEEIVKNVQHVTKCYTWSVARSKILEQTIKNSRIYDLQGALQLTEETLIKFMKQNDCEKEYLEFFQKLWKNPTDAELKKAENQPQYKYLKIALEQVEILKKKYGSEVLQDLTVLT